MKAVLDTNVLISGIFFGGPPGQILDAWRDGHLQFVLSIEILEEYRRVAEVLASSYPGVDAFPILDLFTAQSYICDAPPLPGQVSDDPEDDKFLACALASRTRFIISGDKHLLRVSGYRGITVLKPREFLTDVLQYP